MTEYGKEAPRLGDTLSGLKIIVSPYLPDDTIAVSPKVWEQIKEQYPQPPR